MDLVRRSQEGDEWAFAELFDKYKNLVYRTAYLMLGNTGDAEDALQEVFMKMYKLLATYQPSKGAFTTWLYRITANHCLNQLRRRRPALFSTEQISRMLSTCSHPEPCTGRATQEEEHAAIEQALAQLSEKLRATVVLRYYGELSYAEIAEALDIPVGTVKSRLNLAHRILRR